MGTGVSKEERKLESQINFLKPRDASTEGLWAAWLCPILQSKWGPPRTQNMLPTKNSSPPLR